MAFNLGALAGLGQFADYWQRQQQNDRIAQAFALERAEKLRQDQAKAALFGAAEAGALDSNVQGLAALAAGGSQQTSGMPTGDTMLPAGAPQPLAPIAPLSGGAPSSVPQDSLLNLIAQDESGGRNVMQDVVPPGGGYNPSVGRVTGPSTAQGPWQITNSTWRDVAPAAGVDINQYPTAMSAPVPMQRQVAAKLLQTQGTAPWAPYNPQLRRDLAARGGQQPADLTAGLRPQAQQTASAVASTIDPSIYGRISMKALAQAIDKANPGADPIVKMMALEEAQKLMAPDQRVMMQLMLAQNREQIQMALKDMQISAAQSRLNQSEAFAAGMAGNKGGSPFYDAETKKWYQVTGDGRTRVVDLPAGATKPPPASAAEVPPLQFPDKWEGMPDKPPPNVAPDVWSAALSMAETGQMPSLGFGNAAKRNQIMQAWPAAQHALGIKPSEQGDVLAEYQGQRAGERALGTRQAGLGLALEEARQFVPLAKTASANVSRTQFPTINNIIMSAEEHTGDENVVRLGLALNALAGAYAQVKARGGQSTDAARADAMSVLQKAWSDGQINAAMDQMMKEIEGAGRAPQAVRQGMRRGAGASGGAAAPIKVDENGNEIQ